METSTRDNPDECAVTWTSGEDQVRITGEYRLTDDGQAVPCLEISLNVFRAIDFAEFLSAASKIGDLVDAENYQERGLASAIREAATVLDERRKAELWELLTESLRHRMDHPDDDAGYEHRLRAFARQNGGAGKLGDYTMCLLQLGVEDDPIEQAKSLHDHAARLLAKSTPKPAPTIRQLLQQRAKHSDQAERPAEHHGHPPMDEVKPVRQDLAAPENGDPHRPPDDPRGIDR